MKRGPIIIIEDDEDDKDFITQAVNKCGVDNNIIHFNTGRSALDYLLATSDRPFIIFSDINMPGMNGLELRREINKDEYLRNKSIPFLFLTTAGNRHQVLEAYELTTQGFFIKPDSLQAFCTMMQGIIAYWTTCVHPNNV